MYLIEKLDLDKSNSDSSYRLTDSNNHDLSIVFKKSNLQEKLSNSGLYGGIIAHVVKTVNKLYPSEIKRPTDQERYTDNFLIKYLSALGLTVEEEKQLDVITAIQMLESRGYKVKGKLKETYYSSPSYSVTKN